MRYKRLLDHKKLLILLILAFVVNLLSQHASLIENYYTYGFYPPVAKVLHKIFGPLPFSFGDLLYGAAVLYLFWLAYGGMRFLKSYGLGKRFFSLLFLKLLHLLLLVYLLFNVLWGLNYNRQGIGHQLNLKLQRYTLADVVLLTSTLQSRLNFYAAQIDTVQRAKLDGNSLLFSKGIAAYGRVCRQYPFLTYTDSSIKTSLYTHIGQYIGFTGYYNPFTAEAQIKTTIPVFLKPFVITHEMAHQLGYAAENEANFVAFLSCKQSGDVNFLYSLYYELYRYALREVYYRDEKLALAYKHKLHPRVVRDNEILTNYFIQTENRIEPMISVFYDRYLKLNSQKGGMQTYNQVVALLVAYQKKFGAGSI